MGEKKLVLDDPARDSWENLGWERNPLLLASRNRIVPTSKAGAEKDKPPAGDSGPLKFKGMVSPAIRFLENVFKTPESKRSAISSKI
jgi:hypothetical protein